MSSIDTINELRNGLTYNQARIYDLLWNHYVDTGEAYPIINLQIQLGKVRIDEALSDTSGSLIREEYINGGRQYKLTLLGALLSGHGNFLITYLTNLLSLIKADLESGKPTKEFISDFVYNELNLQSSDEQHIVFRLMTLDIPGAMPFYTSRREVNEYWTITTNENVIPLYHTESIPNYLGDLLLAQYDPKEPYSINERQQYYINRSTPASRIISETQSLVLGKNSIQAEHEPQQNEKQKSSKQTWPDVFESTFESYRVIGSLGEGGAGKVFAVKNDEGKQFALKCLSPDRITTERRKRFKNEMDFCSKSGHLNIIQVVDSGLSIIKDEKCPFYVMPEFPMTLRKLLDKEISHEKVLPLFSQILDGIDAAHKLKAFHRDLKPENILYDPTKRLAVIADFGIAHFEEDIIATLIETKATAKMANLGYSAPEQRVKGEKVDHRADIFSLGLILNEMFTGQVPHGAGYKVIESVAPEFAYLDPLVERMIQNDPNARPDSIDAIKNELIARGNVFVALQRVDAITNVISPKFEPGKVEPLKILSADWNEGRLILILNRAPEIGWTQRFKQPTGNWSSMMGSEPGNFQFFENKAYVPADENIAQQVLDFAKSYVDIANRNYQNDLDIKAKNEEQAYREKLRQEQAAVEARARVVSKLKV